MSVLGCASAIENDSLRQFAARKFILLLYLTFLMSQFWKMWQWLVLLQQQWFPHIYRWQTFHTWMNLFEYKDDGSFLSFMNGRFWHAFLTILVIIIEATDHFKNDCTLIFHFWMLCEILFNFYKWKKEKDNMMVCLTKK
jgi:hypothetical protein